MRIAGVNPLNFTFGYACVSKNNCEVFEHGCIDDMCHFPDYSKGTRTTLSPILVMTSVSAIDMAAMGVSLKGHNVRWCLIQDGSGKFWALDRLQGTQEKFNLKNQNETIVSCNRSYLFSSSQGCSRIMY